MTIVDKIKVLCENETPRTTITQLEKELGYSRGSIHKWNKNKPSAVRLTATATRLGVSPAFLLGNQPFTYWDEMNANRQGLVSSYATEAGLAILQLDTMITTLNVKDPNAMSVKDFVSFVSDTMVAVTPMSNGLFEVELSNNGIRGDGRGSDDELSLDEEVEQLLSGLSPTSSATLMLDGKPASPEAIAALRSALRIGVEQAREMQREKNNE